MFKKILVPIDGSDFAWRALECALEVGKKFESELVFVYVIYPMASYGTWEMQGVEETFTSVNRELEKFAGGLLDEAKKRAAGYPYKVSTVVRSGNPAQQILEMADSDKCDGIVLGSRGLNKFAEMVVGSTTYNVVQHAKVPVITARN